MTSSPNRDHIPQYGNHPESWKRFLFKASRGSDKAVEMLRLAELSFLKELTAHSEPQDLQLEQYYSLLAARLPTSAPLLTIKEFLTIADCVTIDLPDKPLHEHAFYDRLWKRKQSVNTRELVLDAVVHCLRHWSPAEYRHLSETVCDNDPEYNSLNAVAAMLYLYCGWEAGS